MLETFEPFRLWDSSQERWRNFALISPKYTNFEVLDLDSHEIIARNPYPRLSQEQADMFNRSFIAANEDPPYSAGQESGSGRFCPAVFHVPDVLDILDEKDLQEFKDHQNDTEEDFYEEWMKTFLQRRSFGLEAGCVWGDDWSYKVQAIELSEVLEGSVSDDRRFGYFVLNGELKDVYGKDYFDDDAYPDFVLNAPVSFRFSDDSSKTVSSSRMHSDIPHFGAE